METRPLRLSDPEECARWDEFVASHPDGTVFHLSNWLRVLEKTYGFSSLNLSWYNGGEEIVGVLPGFLIRNPVHGKRFISLPFSDYGGPLITDCNEPEEFARSFWQRLPSRLKGVELRSDCGGFKGFQKQRFYIRHVLHLGQNPEIIYKKLEKRTIQYSIRKAIKAGIEVKEENTLAGVENFYNLNSLTRKKHGIPSQSRSFFRNLFDEMVSKGNAKIYIAYHESQPVSGAIFLKFRDTFYYKYNASRPDILARKLTPNHLLTWRAIEEAAARGLSNFDFGRTSPLNTGLCRYKAMWATEAHDVTYSFFPEVSGAGAIESESKAFKLFTEIWKKLPAPLAEIMGPIVLKYFGSG